MGVRCPFRNWASGAPELYIYCAAEGRSTTTALLLDWAANRRPPYYGEYQVGFDIKLFRLFCRLLVLELYDLERDPLELENLAERPERRADRERLRSALHDWRAETGDPLLDPARLRRFTEECDARAAAGERRAAWRYPDYLYASLELPDVWSDGAVLQRDRPLRLAGRATGAMAATMGFTTVPPAATAAALPAATRCAPLPATAELRRRTMCTALAMRSRSFPFACASRICPSRMPTTAAMRPTPMYA